MSALALAHSLIDCGVPVVVCKPRPGADDVVPVVAWREITDAEQCRGMLERFEPGRDALALIGGRGVDLVDVDSKAGGSVDALPRFRHFGVTRTPSGGAHYVVPSAGIGRIQGLEVGGRHVGDYIGGLPDGRSRMLGYLPGSHRPKYGDVGYVAEEPWDVPGCVAAEPDPALVEALKEAARGQAQRPTDHFDVSPERDPSLGVHPYAAAAVGRELARLDDLPHPWAPGSYWDNTTFEVACALLRLGNSGWTGYSAEDAERDLLARAPRDAAWGEREHHAKWRSAVDAVGGAGRRDPGDPARDFGVVDDVPTRESDPAERGGWEPVDVAATLAALEDGSLTGPVPTVGDAGGTCLFYAGRVNSVHGDSSAGKTWTALVTASQEMLRGETVVYVDLEDSPAGVYARLHRDLGVPTDTLGRRLGYLQPDERLGAREADGLRRLLADRRPSLVVVDSTGEALALEGVNPNADDEVARWFRLLPRLAVEQGAAALLLDHATKAGDNDLWPIGSQRKRAAVTGAAYRQKVAVPFGRGQDGKATLVCAKDRHGTYALRQRVASLTVTGGRIELRPETGGAGRDFRPTGLMERVSLALEDAGEPLSQRRVTDAVTGKKDAVNTALATLVREGNVAVTEGPRGARLHRSVRPYREAAEHDAGGDLL